MKDKVILKAQNISKQYRLGLVGTGTLSHDLNRWWASLRGKEDPYLTVGAENDRSKKAESDYVWALRDINFEVYDGDVLGIIGKNGAGKSTLLKILSRVTMPTTGKIKTKGRIASLLEVGTGFHPELTGRENIYLNGAILGMTKTEIKAKEEEIIDFSGCELYIDTPVKRYSSGMRVRLAFAVAAHLEPDILVVDEVLAVGDAEFQKKAIGKMKDISGNDGRTVLFVSHNMAAVKSLCTRGVILENGYSVFEGDINSCVEKYLNSNIEIIDNNLLERNDRRGLGNFKIKSIRKFNHLGNESEIFLSGEKIVFEITIENINKKKVKECRLDFGLDNSSELRISWFSTSLFNKKFALNHSNSFSITMEIPNVPLYAGTYFLTSNLIINGKNEDWLPNAAQFAIENGDFFKTGKVIVANQGNILINHSFR